MNRPDTPQIDKRQAMLGLLAVALLGALVMILLWYLRQPAVLQLIWLLRALAFTVGAVLLPGVAYLSLVPGLLSSLFVKLYGSIATLARPTTRFVMEHDDSYSTERVDDPDGEVYSFMQGSIVFDWDRDPNAFGETATEQIDVAALQNDGGLGDDQIEFGPERGGHGTYITDDPVATTWIRYGEVLEDFRDRALEIINNAQDYALREHGGDSSGHTTRTVGIFMFFFTAMGAGMGYLIFF